MEQVEHSRKGKHLTRDERMVLERMSRGGYPPRDIAAVLDRELSLARRPRLWVSCVMLTSERRSSMPPMI